MKTQGSYVHPTISLHADSGREFRFVTMTVMSDGSACFSMRTSDEDDDEDSHSALGVTYDRDAAIAFMRLCLCALENSTIEKKRCTGKRRN